MSSPDRVTRTTAGLAATATTLMALVAVAAGASSLRPAPAVVRLAQAEVVASLGENAAVRSMAAVVVAVARDLLKSSTVGAALPPRVARDVVISPGRSSLAPAAITTARSPLETLGEYRLDLPPPGC